MTSDRFRRYEKDAGACYYFEGDSIFVGSMSPMANSPAGWYDDLNDSRLERFWNGHEWTNMTQLRAEVGVDLASVEAPVNSHANNANTGLSGAVVVADPPSWAAEVVAVEANESASPLPWWRRVEWISAAALIAITAVVIFFITSGGDSSFATNTEGPGRAVVAASDDEADVAADALDGAGDAIITAPSTDEVPDGETPTSAASEDPALAAEATTESTSTPQPDTTAGEVSTIEAPETTNDETTATASTTTTTVTAAGVNGISAGCLEAMQAAVDAGDPPPQAIHPTFEVCSGKDEWDEAAAATGLVELIDTDAWVTNECIYDADLYASRLCTSAISPDSGPRRIGCGDGRADIEWPFVEDQRTNDEVCANHFQIECPLGVFHNIPVEAMSQEEATAALCPA